MNVLIFNCGSSSQGFKVYQVNGDGQSVLLAGGKARNVATRTRAEPVLEWKAGTESGTVPGDLPTHRLAAEKILTLLEEKQIRVDAIGHRFVHGGPYFDRTVRIDPASLETLRRCLPFAPIHNPNSFSVIEVCLERLPDALQLAVFDTAFHAGMPQVSRTYAIPPKLAEEHGFHRYGFHGLSLQCVSRQAAVLLGRPLEELKLIVCHLGTGGSSVTAVKGGVSLDTSMGYSPLPGLVMSTRSGDLDPEIVLELVRAGRTPEEVSAILNNQSGLLGLSGLSSNLLEIIEAAQLGNAACQLAFHVYAHRLRHYLGAFTWQLGGADAIIFTDDLGMRCWQVREKAFTGVERLGVELDPDRNRKAPVNSPARISSDRSRTQVWVIPTDEESEILHEVITMLQPEHV